MTDSQRRCPDFNSIKVRLEHYMVNQKFIVDYYFNSIKVRLEHKGGDPEEFKQMNFNSIKVRLELLERKDRNQMDRISIP